MLFLGVELQVKGMLLSLAEVFEERGAGKEVGVQSCSVLFLEGFAETKIFRRGVIRGNGGKETAGAVSWSTKCGTLCKSQGFGGKSSTRKEAKQKKTGRRQGMGGHIRILESS